MTAHLLDVAVRDVAADSLGLVLHAPVPTALADLTLDDGRDGACVLGVLGASHVVRVSVPGHALTEQVSCDALAAGGRPLPPALNSGAYAMTSARDRVPGPDLRATAAGLRAVAERATGWLCATFPGADSALTALTARPLAGGGWTWRTWHLYPGRDVGVVVTTRSRWTP